MTQMWIIFMMHIIESVEGIWTSFPVTVNFTPKRIS